MNKYSDIFIIGGGINGTAIAADAAGRGLSVTLCEKDDLASGTSSASTKLIHGGLRYLELYEFGLVRKALREREILMHRAPYLISPLEFILPHEKHLRPAWLIRLGLFFYDYLSPRKHLPRSRSVNLKKDIRGAELLPQFERGFSYYDCFTDDSRLTVLNALSAKEKGATILTHTAFVDAKREQDQWKITLQDGSIHYTKALINAGGPWIGHIQKNIHVKLVKGSHIVVPKLYEGDFAYILQNKDGRIVFAIPYFEQFTLIGTTDILVSIDPKEVRITPEEEEYLCSLVNGYFKKNISPQDIVWSYSGVRCLQDEEAGASKITRDHKIEIDNKNNLPFVTIIGGKITTHRVLAEEALEKLKPFFTAMKPAWTESTPLPGGDINNIKLFDQELKKEFPWLPPELLHRYIKSYGTKIRLILKEATSLSDMGEHFGAGLYQREVDYLINQEWAQSTDDILWRRTKLGLFLKNIELDKLEKYLIIRN